MASVSLLFVVLSFSGAFAQVYIGKVDYVGLNCNASALAWVDYQISPTPCTGNQGTYGYLACENDTVVTYEFCNSTCGYCGKKKSKPSGQCTSHTFSSDAMVCVSQLPTLNNTLLQTTYTGALCDGTPSLSASNTLNLCVPLDSGKGYMYNWTNGEDTVGMLSCDNTCTNCNVTGLFPSGCVSSEGGKVSTRAQIIPPQ